MSCFMTSTPHQILLGRMKSSITRWAEHVACIGKAEVHTGFW